MPSTLEYRSASVEPELSHLPLHWFGWAIYLAMSWTWCIGMFLPVLLVRDYGGWGWVVFAIPNVLGAAAVGWVLRTSNASELILRNHETACGLFSTVTIGFQIGFIVSFIGYFLPTEVGMLLLAGTVLAVYVASGWGDRSNGWAAIVILGLSFLIFRELFKPYARGYLSAPAFYASDRVADVACVCAFGFLLCPYLDSTFHRCRTALSPMKSRLAFSVGFGTFFLAMLVVALRYATAISSSVANGGGRLPGELRCLIGGYFAIQCGFTIAVHVRESRRRLFTLIPAALLALALLVIGHLVPLHSDVRPAEVTYRLFLSFYALVFPAYVWLCMIPGRGRVTPSRHQLIVLAISVLLASPMFWMAFIERKMFWVLPGLAIVLLARLFIRKRDYSAEPAL